MCHVISTWKDQYHVIDCISIMWHAGPTTWGAERRWVCPWVSSWIWGRLGRCESGPPGDGCPGTCRRSRGLGTAGWRPPLHCGSGTAGWFPWHPPSALADRSAPSSGSLLIEGEREREREGEGERETLLYYTVAASMSLSPPLKAHSPSLVSLFGVRYMYLYIHVHTCIHIQMNGWGHYMYIIIHCVHTCMYIPGRATTNGGYM